MGKALVAYFSASGVTGRLAQRLSEGLGADLFEIKPATPYTEADLDWQDDNSRSSVEMNNKAFCPAVANRVQNMAQYDTLFLGFPIWWYVAPTIINTFLEQYDLTGKTIICFATSGTSGMGNTLAELTVSSKGGILKEGKRFDSGASTAELKAWAEQCQA